MCVGTTPAAAPGTQLRQTALSGGKAGTAPRPRAVCDAGYLCNETCAHVSEAGRRQALPPDAPDRTLTQGIFERRKSRATNSVADPT